MVVFVAKGAYQLACFLPELHCVDNTVLHLMHAVIVSTLIGTSYSSHNCLYSNFYHSSGLWRFPSCHWHCKLCSKITSSSYSIPKFLQFLTRYAIPMLWTDLSLSPGIIVFYIVTIRGWVTLLLKYFYKLDITLTNTMITPLNLQWAAKVVETLLGNDAFDTND